VLLIPTILKKSPIHGLGVFTVQKILKNTPIWKKDKITYSFTVEEMNEINKIPKLKKMFKIYSYTDHAKNKDIVYFDIDNGSFMNHSENPNIHWDYDKEIYIAVKDIIENEEILCDYRQFDFNFQKY
jgi:uncharacterized protein